MADVDTKAAEKEELQETEAENKDEVQGNTKEALAKEIKNLVAEDYPDETKKDEKKTEEKEEKEETEKEKTPSEKSEEKDKDKSKDEAGNERKSISPALVDRAVLAGLKSESLVDFASDKVLESYVEALEKLKQSADEKPGEKVPGDDKGTKEVSLDDMFAVLEKVDEDGEKVFDDETIKLLGGIKGLVSSLQGANKEQRDLIEGFVSEIGAIRQGDVSARISNLGKDYEKLFGKDGSISKEQEENREKLGDFVKFVTENAAKKEQTISKEEAFRQGLNGAFGDNVSKLKGEKVAEKAGNRASKATNNPSDSKGNSKIDLSGQHGGSKEDAEERAIAKLEAKYGK